MLIFYAGVSLVVFLSTFRNISNAPGQRKPTLYLGIGLLFVFGVIFHALDVSNIELHIHWVSGNYDYLSILVTAVHTHNSIFLHGFIALATGWVAGQFLVSQILANDH